MDSGRFREFFAQDKKIEVEREKTLYQLLTFGTLCNNAEIKMSGKELNVDGDPTEGALLIAGAKAGIDKNPFSDSSSSKRNIHSIPPAR